MAKYVAAIDQGTTEDRTVRGDNSYYLQIQMPAPTSGERSRLYEIVLEYEYSEI